jgi:hypothetical protein
LSPILVRPVREQLEHDRIIRLLQTKCRRKYEVGINAGAEQVSAVGVGPSAVYPDLVLLSLERGHRLEIVVEVETGESVNHLEALAQWVPYSKLKAAFHLYLPSGMVDVGRRLCEDHQIAVAEIWSYHSIGEDVRFTLVHKAREVAPPAPVRRVPSPVPPPPAVPARRKTAAEAVKRPARATKSAAPRKSVKKAHTSRAHAGHGAESTTPTRSQKRK